LSRINASEAELGLTLEAGPEALAATSPGRVHSYVLTMQKKVRLKLISRNKTDK